MLPEAPGTRIGRHGTGVIWLAAIGGASFLVVCIVGGARLLLLARRTHGLPETVLGIGLFVLGGIATPLSALARAETGLPLELRAGLFGAESVLMSLGIGSFAFFTQRVFRPASAWARALTTALIAGMLAGVALIGVERGYVVALRTPGPGFLLQQLFVLACLVWTSLEALRYARLLDRRTALGLAEPLVAHRMKLWGGGVALSACMSVVTVAGERAGVNLMVTVPGAALIGFMGFGASAAIYFAFFLPEAYARWILARARRTGLVSATEDA
jgi:hypothetical protein